MSEPPAYLAIRFDKYEALQSLISAGLDFDSKLEILNGPTILLNHPPLISIACYFGSFKCFNTLNLMGADIHLPDDCGRQPVHFSACSQNPSIISIINNSTDIDYAVDNEHWLPAHYAAHYGRTEILQWLMICGHDVLSPDNKGRYPLHHACMSGSIECLKTLLTNGYDIHQTDVDDCSALYFAAQSGNAECCKLLIENGAEINEQNNDGNTPLHCAASLGNTEVVECLINKGCKVNIMNKNGMTPAHLAEENDHSDIVKILVSNGCDCDIKNSRGKSLLELIVAQKDMVCLKEAVYCATKKETITNAAFVAASMGEAEFLAVLVDIGVNYKATIGPGLSLLHVSVLSGSNSCVILSLNAGCQVNFVDNQGRTPLIIAAAQAPINIVRTLVDEGSKLGAQDKCGMTALHHAVIRGDLEIISYLLQYGSNIRSTDSFGRSPLHYSLKNRVIYEFLLSKGANPNQVDVNNELAK